MIGPPIHHYPELEPVLIDLARRSEQSLLSGFEGAHPAAPLLMLYLKSMARARDALALVSRWAPLLCELTLRPGFWDNSTDILWRCRRK